MNKYYSMLISLFLLFSVGVSAQGYVRVKNPTELKKKLKEQSERTKTIVAEFTQEKHVSFMKKTQVSKGHFYYQQSNKMRWEQRTPFNYILLMSNGKVSIKENGKEKNIKGANKMMGKINQLMLGLINGEAFDSKEFETTYFANSIFYLVKLTPKNKRLQGLFNTIELTFSKKTIRLKKLTFLEKSGDKSVMNFFKAKFNTKIAPSIFNTL